MAVEPEFASSSFLILHQQKLLSKSPFKQTVLLLPHPRVLICLTTSPSLCSSLLPSRASRLPTCLHLLFHSHHARHHALPPARPLPARRGAPQAAAPAGARALARPLQPRRRLAAERRLQRRHVRRALAHQRRDRRPRWPRVFQRRPQQRRPHRHAARARRHRRRPRAAGPQYRAAGASVGRAQRQAARAGRAAGHGAAPAEVGARQHRRRHEGGQGGAQGPGVDAEARHLAQRQSRVQARGGLQEGERQVPVARRLLSGPHTTLTTKRTHAVPSSRKPRFSRFVYLSAARERRRDCLSLNFRPAAFTAAACSAPGRIAGLGALIRPNSRRCTTRGGNSCISPCLGSGSRHWLP